MYYEIIYEDGSHSVAFEEDENALVEALSDHHERAKSGLPGHAPAVDRESGAPLRDIPAVRIVRVLTYDDHPADLSAPALMNKDRLIQKFNDSLAVAQQGKKDSYDVQELLFQMTPQPRLVNDPHDSNYEAEETGELDPALWGGEE